MLTGAIPETHRLTNYDMHPIAELPTIFRLVKNAFPDEETAAYRTGKGRKFSSFFHYQ